MQLKAKKTKKPRNKPRISTKKAVGHDIVSEGRAIGAMFVRNDRADVLARFKTALYIAQVLERAGGEPTTMEVLSRESRQDKNTLYEYAQWGRTFSHSEVKSAVTGKSATRINTSHFIVISRIEDAGARQAVMAQLRETKTTWDQFKKLVRAATPKDRRGGEGRTHLPAVLLKQIHRWAAKDETRVSTVEASLERLAHDALSGAERETASELAQLATKNSRGWLRIAEHLDAVAAADQQRRPGQTDAGLMTTEPAASVM